MREKLFYPLVILVLVLLGALLVPRVNEQTKESKDTFSEDRAATQGAQSDEVNNSPTTTKSDEVLVKKVVDGDTIELENGSRLRYIGIDTPETVDPKSPVQCFGRESSAKNKELVEGKKVRLELDVSNEDRYGRLLRYVYVGDTFVNEYLVREGFAKASSYPPDVKYQDKLRTAEASARASNKGLWSSCTVAGSTSQNYNVSGSLGGDCKIKGNISSSGEKIYHLPSGNFYSKTVIDESKGERWFCSESEAQAAGWRASKS
jgi:micrococcal nuclease